MRPTIQPESAAGEQCVIRASWHLGVLPEIWARLQFLASQLWGVMYLQEGGIGNLIQLVL